MLNLATRSRWALEAGAMTLVLAIAAFWRFYNLDYRSLWYDEVEVTKVANLPTLMDVVAGAKSHASAPPIDYVLRHFWQLIGGLGDAWLRGYSALWGVLAIFLIYLVGRQLYGKRVGVVAALFLAVSKFQVHYSAEIKFYAPLVAMYILVLYVWLVALERKSKVGWLLFGVSGLLGVYVHPYVVFAILFCVLASLAQCLLAGLKGLKSRWAEAHFREVLTVGVSVGLLYLPLVLWDFAGQEKGWAPPELTWDFLRTTISDFVLPGTLGLGVSLIAIMFALWAFLRRWRFQVMPVWMTVCISIFLVLILDIIGRYPLMDKQLIFVGPFLLLLVAEGLIYCVDMISASWQNTNRIGITLWAPAAIIFVVALGSIPILADEKNPANWQSNNWRSAISVLASNLKPGDTILWTARQGSTDPTYSSVVHWYLERYGVESRALELVQWWDHKTVSLRDIRDLAASNRFHSVWLFGQELDRTFQDAGLSDYLTRDAAGNIRLYYVPDLTIWDSRLLRQDDSYLIRKSNPLRRALVMGVNYVYPLTLTIDNPNGVMCSLQIKMDGTAQNQIAIPALSTVEDLITVLQPPSTGEHVLEVGVDSCESLIIQEASAPWVSKIDPSGVPSKIASIDMRPIGGAQYDTDATSRNFIWEFKAADTIEFPFWTSKPLPLEFSLTAATSGPSPAMVKVRVDNMVLGDLQFPNEWTVRSLNAAIPTSGLHQVSLQFANDYFGPDGDRNVMIQSAELKVIDESTVTLRTLDLTALAWGYHQGSMPNNGVLEMWWAGPAFAKYQIKPGEYTFTVEARGQLGCGIWPLLRFSVDGKEIGTRKVDHSDLQTLEFPNVVLSGGDPHTIGIEFVQPGDCEQPGQDVNLFVQSIRYERTNPGQ